MSDPLLPGDDPEGDARLRAMFGAEPAAAHDPYFVHAAMQRVAVRRFWFNLLAGLPWLIAASAALWAFAPVLAELGRGLMRWWREDALLAHAAVHLMVLITPATAVLVGLVFLAPAHERRL